MKSCRSFQNLRREIDERESLSFKEKDRRSNKDSNSTSASLINQSKKPRFHLYSQNNILCLVSSRIDNEPSANADADDALDELDDEISEEESDDEAELMAELERIRKERAAEKAAQEEKEKAKQVIFNFTNFLIAY